MSVWRSQHYGNSRSSLKILPSSCNPGKTRLVPKTPNSRRPSKIQRKRRYSENRKPQRKENVKRFFVLLYYKCTYYIVKKAKEEENGKILGATQCDYTTHTSEGRNWEELRKISPSLLTLQLRLLFPLHRFLQPTLIIMNLHTFHTRFSFFPLLFPFRP